MAAFKSVPRIRQQLASFNFEHFFASQNLHRASRLRFVESKKQAPISVTKEAPVLTEEQRTVLRFATSAHRPSLFLSGQAGTGKSFLLRHLIHDLQRLKSNQNENSWLAVTGTTGVAASNLPGGQTLHAWLQLPPYLLQLLTLPESKSEFHILLRNWLWSSGTRSAQFQMIMRRRWRRVQTLIIDECSMLHPSMLDILDYLGRNLRSGHSHLPFGGVQLILCGDFMQLPPVVRHSPARTSFEASCTAENETSAHQLNQPPQNQQNWMDAFKAKFVGDTVGVQESPTNTMSTSIQPLIGQFENNVRHHEFCFDAESWPHIVKTKQERHERHAFSNSSIFILKTMHRQVNDTLFCQLLNHVRTTNWHSSDLLAEDRNQCRVIDALLRHLRMPFPERQKCPLFHAIKHKKVKNLLDLVPFVQLSHDNDESDQDLDRAWEFNLNKIHQAFGPIDSCHHFKGSKTNAITHTDLSISLFPKKATVDEVNSRCLMSLPLEDAGPIHWYLAHDEDPSSPFKSKKYSQNQSKDYRKSLAEKRRNAWLPSEVELRVGARVMLLRNIDPKLGLVNGSIGVVESFEPVSSGEDSPDDHKNLVLPRVRFPHPSVHHSYTLSAKIRREIQPKLSKEGLSILVNPHREYFLDPDAALSLLYTADQDAAHESNLLDTAASRVQLPLRLAWSFSIHKSQGQTFQRLEVDLSHVFEPGQVYVALSRCTSLHGLRVLGYNAANQKKIWKLMRHERVVEFYKRAESAA